MENVQTNERKSLLLVIKILLLCAKLLISAFRFQGNSAEN